jgi:hypothetical protein
MSGWKIGIGPWPGWEDGLDRAGLFVPSHPAGNGLSPVVAGFILPIEPSMFSPFGGKDAVRHPAVFHSGELVLLVIFHAVATFWFGVLEIYSISGHPAMTVDLCPQRNNIMN